MRSRSTPYATSLLAELLNPSRGALLPLVSLKGKGPDSQQCSGGDRRVSWRRVDRTPYKFWPILATCWTGDFHRAGQRELEEFRVVAWEKETDRFFAALKSFDDYLASAEPHRRRLRALPGPDRRRPDPRRADRDAAAACRRTRPRRELFRRLRGGRSCGTGADCVQDRV